METKPITVNGKLIKFADDTYLIISASNFHTRSAEVDNIEHWAQANNLKVNREKSKEIILTHNRRKRNAMPPPQFQALFKFYIHQNSGEHSLLDVQLLAQTLHAL